jgi:hypothetical protein
MKEKTNVISGCESATPKLESMKIATASQRSNQPNTTNSNQEKPKFTPPPQKKTATEE